MKSSVGLGRRRVGYGGAARLECGYLCIAELLRYHLVGYF